MLGWYADNLDYHRHVSVCTEPLPRCLILDKGIWVFIERVYVLDSIGKATIMLFSVYTVFFSLHEKMYVGKCVFAHHLNWALFWV